MVRNFDELLEKLKMQENKTVVVAAAHGASAIEAAVLAKKEQFADSLLIGDENYIRKFLQEHHPEFQNAFEIINTGADLQLAAKKSVEAILDGKGDLILKGKCDTATLLKAALDKERGLRTGEILSDVLAYEHPERLVLMSDGGINLYPTLQDKVSIIKNAVQVAHKLENDNPKVALLAAVEVVNLKMPNTIDDATICKMNQRGQITGCRIDGLWRLTMLYQKKLLKQRESSRKLQVMLMY